MRPCLFGHALALGSLLAFPATAADRMVYFDPGHERIVAAGYVGVTFSMAQSSERKPKSSLRFGAGLRHQPRAALPASASAPSTFELRWAGTRHSGLYIGGRGLGAAQGNGGPKASEVLLILAGVAASAFLVTQLAGSDDDDDDERCFIEPELCD